MNRQPVTVLRWIAFSITLVLLPRASHAAPVVSAGGVVNTASFTPAGLPTYGIAQGSIFAVFGSGLGPAAIVNATNFPLLTTLGGTSIQITSGATTTNAFMIFSQDGQLAAILPSSTPIGTASLTVTFNGETSAPVSFQVVESAFGIFTVNNRGAGPAVAQNFVSESSQPFNNIITPAQPGQVVILWGTGLGPYSGAEDVAPVPSLASPIGNDVTVFVGGQPATIDYRGRTPCCAGEDEIVFHIPEGVLGCYVPVQVQVNDVLSNAGTIAISSASSAPCSDSNGLSASELQLLEAGGNVNIGTIRLRRLNQRGFDQAGMPTERTTDSANVNFRSFSSSGLLGLLASPPLGFLGSFVSTGYCAVYTFAGTNGAFNILNSFQPTPLDPGAPFAITGPNGTKQVPPATLGASPAGNGPPPYLSPGSYTVTGPGGADVGPIQASTNLPATPFTWTNEPPISSPDVSLSQDLWITWSGGNPNDFVTVNGYSVLEGGEAGTGFVCSALNSAGRLTVPALLLSALVPTPGVLSVINTSNAGRFQASGLNLGLISATTAFDDPVFYAHADVVLTGTATSLSVTLTGAELLEDPTATGSIEISATGVSTSSETVYTGGGTGSGTTTCDDGSTGNWTITITATLTVSPAVPSLETSGGSLSGSSSASFSGTICGSNVSDQSTDSLTGTVSPGGAVTLSLI